MIRVCHVQLFSRMGGVQRAMLDVFGQLDRSRYELHVVCKEIGPLTQELNRLQVPVHLMSSLREPMSPWHDYRAYRAMRRLFRDQDFQIVHTHASKPGFLGRLAARKAGVPIVIHQVQSFAFHDTVRQPRRWMHEQLERYAAHRCDCMLFVNHEERAWAVTHDLMPADNCLTIFPGVDLAAVHPEHRPLYRQRYRASWEMSEDEFVILFVGDLVRQKQPLMLAEIAARLDGLRSRMPWRLIVAGAGPEAEPLAQAIKTMSISHRVKLLDRQKDYLGLLHAADVVLLPSLYESLPRALIEAQAAGLPTVASDVRGSREVVINGTGFLCPVGKADTYAAAIARLMDTPELRVSMGAAARRHAEQKFDKAANGSQVSAVYESLLAS